MKAGQQKGTN